MKSYSPQRLYTDDVEELRRIERSEKRKASVPSTVGYLIRYFKLAKKLNPEQHQKIKFTLN